MCAIILVGYYFCMIISNFLQMLNYEDCIIVCFKITSDTTVQYRIQHRILPLNIAWKR